MYYFLKKLFSGKFKKVSYSISGVDLVIDHIFRNKKNGFYVDIGCNHPVKFNNTYLLHKRGWSGINIDFDKTSIKFFNKFRPKDFNVRTIVSDKEEDKTIYFYHARSTINTIEKNVVDSRSTKPTKVIIERSQTLNSIIENSPLKDKKINFMSVDVEGHEYDIIKNFNFEKYYPDFIVLECHNLNLKKLELYNQSLDFITNHETYKFLIEKKYKLVNWLHADLIFVRENFSV